MPVGKKLFLVQQEENVKKQIQILEIKNESKICILYQGSTFLLLKSTFQEKWTKSRKVLKVLKKSKSMAYNCLPAEFSLQLSKFR